MFTRQAQQINESLWQGGLSAAQSHAIANLLGQCRQTLEHRGPVKIDYTSPEMKLISPEAAQIQFPEIQLQPPESFAPRERYPDIPPEELPPYDPDPLPPPNGPQYPGSGNNPGGGSGGGSSGGCCVPDWLTDLLEWAGQQWEQLKKNILASGGAYIRVDVVANTGGYNVNLKNENDVEGNICTFGNDTIKGLDKEEFVESISDELDDYVEDYLGDDASGTPTTVVTGIEISGSKLQVTTRTVRVLSAGTTGQGDSIDLITCE